MTCRSAVTLEKVAEEIGRLRRASGSSSEPAASAGAGRDVTLRGLTLTWVGLRAGLPPQRVGGSDIGAAPATKP